LAVERAAVSADHDRLRARFEQEKEQVRAFLSPSAAEGGARRRRIRAAMLFIVTYPQLPLLSWPRELLATLIEFEQLFVVFRQRHARMVERIIGRRTGTGGSAGVEYLDETALRYRIFRDLWAVRTMQVRGEASPELANAAFYDFANG
jgi:tryptophan 2,3-dioxygenase